MDLDADLEAMTVEDLLAYQQEATRLRLAANDAGRRAQAEIDRRSEERARQRAAEDAKFGAVAKPPAQQVFGTKEDSTDG